MQFDGSISYTDIERLFKDRREDNSILAVDSHKSYIKFKNNFDFEIQQIENGKNKKKIFHIQVINAYPSKLKQFMVGIHGVATNTLHTLCIGYLNRIV